MIEKGKEEKEELVRMFVRVPKSKRDIIYNVVAKSSYSNASELIRAGIDKELNLQIYKDNLDIIIQELNNIVDYKLDGFIKSQRKLYANNVRISALNTYVMGEVMKRIITVILSLFFINYWLMFLKYILVCVQFKFEYGDIIIVQCFQIRLLYLSRSA